MPLRRADKIGLAVVIGGLVLVGLSAAEDRAVAVSRAEEWGVLVASVLLGVLAVPLARLAGASGAAALGAIAGLAFGATSVAARMLPGSLAPDQLVGQLGELLRSPATYALAVAAAVAMLTYSTALQRGTVTQATAPLVVGETVAPALVGLLLLGRPTPPGLGLGGDARLRPGRRRCGEPVPTRRDHRGHAPRGDGRRRADHACAADNADSSRIAGRASTR